MAILLDKRTIFATVFFVSFFGFALGAQAATLGKPTNNLGLVGYWNFNEGTSTIATDNSGYGNHGTTSNISHPPTATNGWSPGKLGSAITFDGSNDYVSMAKEYTDVTNTFTIAMSKIGIKGFSTSSTEQNCP